MCGEKIVDETYREIVNILFPILLPLDKGMTESMFEDLYGVRRAPEGDTNSLYSSDSIPEVANESYQTFSV